MPIDVDLFKKETSILIEGLGNGINLCAEGHYNKSIEMLTDSIISAGRLFKRDSAVGKALRLDKTILVAKGYQLKAYLAKMDAKPEDSSLILEKIGDMSFENPYFLEIANALKEWAETSERGNFYSRPRED
jgi:hypothetical protein